ncbi:hypothetical protein PAMC26510_04765 [Caballeronia sordidicola]|uniref:Uncharacterized protein n=1 Tax=Caballeronia sordidicola TaxID=196367 RepID=A0A242N8X2_CABSO|nr:hypothetical protein PAMC26510_04765 [Caballeronia sordidicola]
MRIYARPDSLDHGLGQNLMQGAHGEVEVFHGDVEYKPEIVVIARCLAHVHAERRMKEAADAFPGRLILLAAKYR